MLRKTADYICAFLAKAGIPYVLYASSGTEWLTWWRYAFAPRLFE